MRQRSGPFPDAKDDLADLIDEHRVDDNGVCSCARGVLDWSDHLAGEILRSGIVVTPGGESE